MACRAEALSADAGIRLRDALRRDSLRSPLRSERRLVGSAGNAPVRHFRLCFLTPDLQSGSRITSREMACRAEAAQAHEMPAYATACFGAAAFARRNGAG